MAEEFYWDKKSQRYKYKDSGKYAPLTAIQSLTRKSIKQGEKRIALPYP